MFSLCYVNAASAHMNQEELVLLLECCQKKNALINVTGLQHNGQGTFIQVLEGDVVVEDLYQKIKADARHHRVNGIGRKPIEQRSFPNWTMGFKSLEGEQLPSIQGFSDFMTSDDSAAYVSSHTSFTFCLLSYFKLSSLGA